MEKLKHDQNNIKDKDKQASRSPSQLIADYYFCCFHLDFFLFNLFFNNLKKIQKIKNLCLTL